MATTNHHSDHQSHTCERTTVNGNSTTIVHDDRTVPRPLRIPRHVLLLSLQSPSWFDTEYENLLHALTAESGRILKAEDPEDALGMFSHREVASSFRAVLIADHGITFPRHSPIWHLLLKNYIRKGGRVIICCGFPCGVIPRDFDTMFSEIEGLDWKFAGCSRGEYGRAEAPGQGKDALPDVVDWNAVKLRAEGMKPGESWYSDSTGDSAAAMAKVGEGWLGYVGNVDVDGDTAMIILRMCGFDESEGGRGVYLKE
ncbi:hypothetical protein QC761_702950 [Podospora bellae-mahoneyi]|uniref:Uncharacterized protein n=1 Tax=Podospora bellae-mahoneyi TaxID=2093777 RepID=A0ABR0F7I0_9PEZI|nr:hypothetical protein QC761_702950 [Podospora bellae-mahoneyi]